LTEPLNIAVLGTGYWGPNLIRNVSQSPNAVLHTVCDVDETRLNAIAEQYAPLHQTTNMKTILTDPHIHGVIIATPANTHAEIAEQVLNSGKHALVEKPLALSSTDAQRLTTKAKQSGLVLMVGHVFLYNSAVLMLKQLIDSGEIGEVFYIYSTRVNLGRIRQDLNAFWNLAPHDISITNYLLGQMPKTVSARGFSFLQMEHNLHDVVFAVLEYPGNVAAHIHTSWLDPNKIRRMTVVGSKKMVVYDDVGEHAISIYDKGAAWTGSEANYGSHRLMTYTGDIHIPKINKAEPLREEVENFFACIQHNQIARSDGDSGLDVVRVLEAVDESLANHGQVIML